MWINKKSAVALRSDIAVKEQSFSGNKLIRAWQLRGKENRKTSATLARADTATHLN